jgi:peptidylprolyl isomerase
MNKYISIVIGVVLIVLGIWFSIKGKAPVLDNNVNQVEEQKINSPEVTSEIKPEVIPENNIDKVMSAILHTNKGDITIEFLDTQAPNTVANFRKLAGDKFYDGIKFHRVIKGFMIQGGDPLTKDDSKVAMWGTGGPGYKFADELGPKNKNDIGTISMANSGPNTNGSQFFINTAANNFLDGKHTVFGKVVLGMEVVTAIENTPTGAMDRPVSPMIINSITLQ